MKKYLYKLGNIYNNKKSFYEIDSLPESSIVKSYIFSGEHKSTPKDMGLMYLYLELSEELNQQNHYQNLQRLLNLISLETIQISNVQPIPINQLQTFKEILNTYQAKKHYDPKTRFHSLAPETNHILRVQRLVSLLPKLKEKDFEKFDNALNTFVWALEIKHAVNPHLKFTLYMTLFLSSIEQLTDDPKYCRSHKICEVCKKELFHHEKNKGQQFALNSLIVDLLTGSGVDDAIERVNRLYSKLRSSFLHSGIRYGEEKIGGFLADISKDIELLEDEVNIIKINSMLLEQFVIRRVKQ